MTALTAANLIPIARRTARQRSLRARRWAVACVIYALALGAGYIAYYASREVQPADLPQRIAAQQTRADQLQRAIASQSERLTSTTKLLLANDAVDHQPNWSALLGVLANALGENVVLGSCRLSPTGITGTPGAGLAGSELPGGAMLSPSGYRVRLAGHGRTQTDVSQYSLRLESLGLFSSVRVLQTRREPFGAGHAIAFEIDCIIGEEANKP